MSGCELWMVAQPRDDLAESDWAWLSTWLSEALGVAVRVFVCRDPRAVRCPEVQPVMYHGDREFLRQSQRGNMRGATWIGLEATSTDWVRSACTWLRQDRRDDPNQLPNQAILDRSILRLANQLDQFYPQLRRAPYWPSPYKCAVVLTHDVDAVDRWSRAHVWHLARHVRERVPGEGLRALMRLPWATIRCLWDSPPLGRRLKECIAIEKERGVRATYLFFAPESTYRKAFDGWYTLKTCIDAQQTVGALWQDLLASGFEIGLHLSIGAHDNPRAIAAEWHSLREHVPTLATCRSHYLKQKPGVTAAALASAGARVELNLVSTGFSRGSGLPFPFLEGDGALYRVPTVIEDSELEVDGGDPTVQKIVWGKWEAVLGETERNGTLATVLLHPENPGANEMLARLLAWGKAHGAWMPAAAELVDHWQERRAMHRLIGMLEKSDDHSGSAP